MSRLVRPLRLLLVVEVVTSFILSLQDVVVVMAFQKNSKLKHSFSVTNNEQLSYRLSNKPTSDDQSRLSSSCVTFSCYASYSSSTQLNSLRKFRNIEEMLDTFREEPVLVYFTSMNCGPCRLQKKELAHVHEMVGPEYAIKILSIDTKKWPHVGTKFAIGKLPCLLFMKDKEIITRLEGFTTAQELVEKVYFHAPDIFDRRLP